MKLRQREGPSDVTSARWSPEAQAGRKALVPVHLITVQDSTRGVSSDTPPRFPLLALQTFHDAIRQKKCPGSNSRAFFTDGDERWTLKIPHFVSKVHPQRWKV